MKHSIVSTEEFFLSAFGLCWCLGTEGRKKVFLVPHAHAAKLNVKNLFYLELSNGFGFIPVFGLEVL